MSHPTCLKMRRKFVKSQDATFSSTSNKLHQNEGEALASIALAEQVSVGRHLVVEALPQWLALGAMLTLVFGGCCSNVGKGLK